MKNIKSITIGVVASLCLVLMSFSTDEAVEPQSGINTFTENISLAALKDLDEFTINTDDKNLNVTSFRVVIAPKEGAATLKSYRGNKISDTWMINIIHASLIGDRILIDKVIALDSSDLTIKCKPALYTVTE
jgi:hypothetical protein